MKMTDGLWVVEFESVLGLSGKGVMVLNGSRVLGGDMGYYYSGQCTINENRISGSVAVVRFDPNTVSVFGPIERFTLSFDGQISGNTFEVIAKSTSFPSVPMTIKGIKKENL
jgi:hypothetical protein